MARPGTVIGWKLDREQRAQLLERFPPRYAQAVADHITLEKSDAPQPPDVTAKIVGHVDDGQGVEAMVVTLDGSSDRPDGSTFHITWSLGPGRRARESNDVIRDHSWSEIDSIPVTVTPARF